MGDQGSKMPMPEEHLRASRLQLLADVGRKTTAILSREELLRSAVHIIRETFNYFMVNIFLVDGQDLVVAACSMPELQHAVDHLRLRIGSQGITGWVAAHGRPLNVPDVAQDPRYSFEYNEELSTRSELAVPITLKGTVIGVLDVQSTQVGAFTDLDVFTLQTVADQLAIAIENARLYGELRRELAVRRRIEALLGSLHAATLAMELAASPDAVFVTVGEQLARMNLSCALYLVDPARSTVTVAYSNSIEGGGGTGVAAAPGACGLPRAARWSWGSGRHSRGLRAASRLFSPLVPSSRRCCSRTGCSGFSRSARRISRPTQHLPCTCLPTRSPRPGQRPSSSATSRRACASSAPRRSSSCTRRRWKLSAGWRAGWRTTSTTSSRPSSATSRSCSRACPLAIDGAARSPRSRRPPADAAELTRQLLAFSRKQVLQPRAVDLNDLIEDMRSMLQAPDRRGRSPADTLRPADAAGPRGPHPGPAGHREPRGQLARCHAVRRHALHRDIVPAGGEEHAAVPCRPAAGEYCLVSVSDTGTGMDEQTMSRLFEPFFTTKERGRGTGLGLSTAYGIVKQSGGFIFCASRPGEGTTFTICLPSITGSAERAARSRAARRRSACRQAEARRAFSSWKTSRPFGRLCVARSPRPGTRSTLSAPAARGWGCSNPAPCRFVSS